MTSDRLTTGEAAARLGVKTETLYAYVSRGLISRQSTPGGKSTYALTDIERLARAGRRTRQLPALVFPSSLSNISAGHLTYRGASAVFLAAEHTFEEVAEWLWLDRWQTDTRWPFDPDALDVVLAAQAIMPPHSLPLERFRVIAAMAGAYEGPDPDHQPELVAAAGRRLLRLLAHGLPRADHREARRAEPARSIAEVLWTRLTRLPRNRERVRLLDATLVLLADHELASSTLAARLAAMVRGSTNEVVGTGLNVIGGSRHGGASLAIEALLREAARQGVGHGFAPRLDEPQLVRGFGHSLYPDGDPRARFLLDALASIDPPGERRALVEQLLLVAEARGMPAPNVDVALAAISFCADMPPGSGEAIFALARSAGWIAHAIEQYEQPTFMRGRVDYIGRNKSEE